MAKITKTKSNKYHAYVYMGKNADGKRIIESVTDADRRVVAKEVERLESLRGNSGLYITLSAAMDAYIRMKKPVLSPSTVRGYRSIIKMTESQFSDICACPLVNLHKDDFQTIINSLVDKGRSPKMVRNTYGFYAAVLKYHDCPAFRVALPERVRPKTYEPTAEDVKSLVNATDGTPLNIPVRLAMYGLRRGEICALKYPDDFRGGKVHISKSMVKTAKQDYAVKAPKNITSNRIVPIDKQLLQDIKKQGYVTDMHPDQLSVQFGRFIKSHGFPHIRFHDMRHFFAAYMHELGISDALIMRIGGWATDNCMKRVYRYALDNEKTEEVLTKAIASLQ